VVVPPPNEDRYDGNSFIREQQQETPENSFEQRPALLPEASKPVPDPTTVLSVPTSGVSPSLVGFATSSSQSPRHRQSGVLQDSLQAVAVHVTPAQTLSPPQAFQSCVPTVIPSVCTSAPVDKEESKEATPPPPPTLEEDHNECSKKVMTDEATQTTCGDECTAFNTLRLEALLAITALRAIAEAALHGAQEEHQRAAILSKLLQERDAKLSLTEVQLSEAQARLRLTLSQMAEKASLLSHLQQSNDVLRSNSLCHYPMTGW